MRNALRKPLLLFVLAGLPQVPAQDAVTYSPPQNTRGPDHGNLRTDLILAWRRAVALHRPGEMDQAADDIEGWPTKDIQTAIDQVKMLAESRPGRPLVIIFSDGLDTSSWMAGDTVVETAKHSDAVVYAVSSGKHPKMTFLQDLTQFTGGALIKIESTEHLDRVFLDILEEFRRRYLLTYSPAGALSKGWHKLEVRLKNPRLAVKARPGFLIP